MLVHHNRSIILVGYKYLGHWSDNMILIFCDRMHEKVYNCINLCSKEKHYNVQIASHSHFQNNITPAQTHML